jgi:hypothetical protein
LPPPGDFGERQLDIGTIRPSTHLFRIHRTVHDPLRFGRPTDPARRQRWDAPDASYGVCYVAMEEHIAFAETLLRDLKVRHVHDDDLRPRSLARLEVRLPRPLRVVDMNGEHLIPLGADASVGSSSAPGGASAS